MEKVYLVDVGVLLSKEDSEYNLYSTVYDKQRGYYDEAQFLTTSKEFAKEFVEDYVKKGVVNTYGVITEQFVDTTIYEEFIEEEKKGNKYIELIEFGAYETYDLLSVVIGIYKENDKEIKELFEEKESY